MKVGVEVIVEVDGKEVYRGPSRSFVTNFAKVFLWMLGASGNMPLGSSGSTSTTITAPDGSSQTVWTE